MLSQPVSKPTTENWENEGGSLRPRTEAEVLGVTRFLSETFVVGGYAYTNLRDAIAQGRRMQQQDAGL